MTKTQIFYFHLLVTAIQNRLKVDPSGYQSGLIDSSGGPIGAWQGSHPPPLPPSHHHHHHPARLPYMPPRDLHFSPQAQHMRQFRPSIPPSTSPEYRIYDLNKRLSMRTDESDNLWWDSFVNEFFEEDATIIISIYADDGPKRFHVGRILISRFFRTLFDGGISEVYFQLKQPKEIFHPPTISIDCEHASLITYFGRPSFIKICTEGHFLIEFTFDDLMRIKSWHINIKQHQELIPRSVVAIPTDDPTYLGQLSKNFTRNGLTSSMLNFLRFCEVLEPMQEIMSRHKTTTFSPRDCLKTILHQRWSKTCSDTRPAAKTRRKRKNAMENNDNTSSTKDSDSTTPTKKRATSSNLYPPPASNQPMTNTPGDVMIVGEPTLMGGEMDDEDERYISRLENPQYDSNNTPLIQSKQQQLISNMKREQISFPNSPQQQQQQLPSIFSNHSPTSMNGEGKKRSTNSPQTSITNSSSISEKKQEAHTPPVTPQQTIATAS